MEKKRNYIFHTVLLVFVFIIVFAAIGYGFYVVSLGASYFDNEAKDIAKLYSKNAADGIKQKIETSFSKVKDVASEVSSVSGSDEMDDFGERTLTEAGFISLQFLKGGYPEYSYGEGGGYFGIEKMQDIIASGKSGNSGIYIDESVGMPCIAVYCPVYGSSETDGVLAYYSVSGLFDGNEELDEYTKYYCFATIDGSIIEVQNPGNIKTDVSHNIFTYLHTLTESKSETDIIEQQTKSKVGGAFFLHIGADEYIATSIPVESLNGDCFVFQLFSAEQLLGNEYALYDRLLGVCVFLSVAVVFI
ncbi:MAG: hypothetical protein ACI4QR_05585 [Eubacteriales bacterium]